MSIDSRNWRFLALMRKGRYDSVSLKTFLTKEPNFLFTQETVWGDAFKVEGQGKRKALGNLVKREVTLGGYDIICTRFMSRDNSTTRTVIVYAATQRNSYYLGDSDVNTMSSEIVDAHGHCGSNVEYVVNLAEYCRNYIPEDNDLHLFELERRVKELLKMRLIESVDTRADNETKTRTDDETIVEPKPRTDSDLHHNTRKNDETYQDLDFYDSDQDSSDCDTDSLSSVDSDDDSLHDSE